MERHIEGDGDEEGNEKSGKTPNLMLKIFKASHFSQFMYIWGGGGVTK
jgi:hypothetical protein